MVTSVPSGQSRPLGQNMLRSFLWAVVGSSAPSTDTAVVVSFLLLVFLRPATALLRVVVLLPRRAWVLKAGKITRKTTVIHAAKDFISLVGLSLKQEVI